MMIFRCLSPLIWLESCVLEGFAGKLPWATFLEIPGSGDIRSCTPIFCLTIWFQMERGKALLSVAIIGHVLRSMVKSEVENDMEAEFLMTSNDGSSLCGDEELSW
jgi:hypothetical protein